MLGRPSDYTEDIANEILTRLEDGEGLWKICLDAHLPARYTVLRWARDRENFRDRYARAMELYVEASIDDIDRISRDGGKDQITEEMGGITVTRTDHEHINRSKLIVDSIKWAASKRAPHKYGDRIAHQMLDEHGKPAKPRLIVVVDGAPGEKE